MPKVQKPAPDFKATAVVDGAVKEVALSDYKGNDAAAKFKEIGAELIGASVDSQFSHLQWVKAERKKGGLGGCNFPLLADISHKIAKDYDVLIEDGPDAGIALRGLFIIDGKGILRSSIVNDLPVGRNPEEVLRLVQAFQYTDVHGEVCPASWKPGSKTMKADPVGSLEYFSTAN